MVIVMKVFGYYIDRYSLILSIIDMTLFFVFFSMAFSYQGEMISSSFSRQAIIVSAFMSSSLMLLLLIAFGSYKAEAWRSLRATLERLTLGGIVGACLLVLLQNVAPSYVVWHESPSRIFAGLATTCMAALVTRVLAQNLFQRARLRPKAFVLGVGARARAIWEACGDGGSTRLASFFYLGPEAPHGGAVGLPSDRVRAMPPNLSAALKRESVGEIVVALDERRGALPLEILLDCRLHGVRVLDSISFLERESGRVDLRTVYPSWLIFSAGFRFGFLNAYGKRLFDLVSSALLLLLASPLMLLVALAIELDDGGPVFYAQERVGQNGKVFWILKFRSMVRKAEKPGQACWASRGDSRVTRVGHVLRRYRFDELPQLLNVLKGEMSLVGPRPERPQFVRQLAERVPLYNERHSMKPGITGWAQVNYAYADSIEDSLIKLEYDLFYIKNWSLFLDIVILIQTVRTVALGEGAR